MRDLSDLKERILDYRSKIQFNEAVRAFQSGAFRAAIVQTWITVEADLISKIRDLADGGNKEAKKLIDDLDSKIENQNVIALQKFESNLLDEVRKMQMLTPREQEELTRIKKDRDVCAHPAFEISGELFTPSSELARVHLASAVDNCLAIPPIIGKELVSKLLADLDSDYWPAPEKLSNFLKEKYFTRSRETAKQNVTELLVKSAINPPSSNEEIRIRPAEIAFRCRQAINNIFDFSPELVKQAINSVIQKSQRENSLEGPALLRILGSIGHIPATWKALNHHHTDHLLVILENPNVEDLVDHDAFSSGVPSNDALHDLYNQALGRATKNTENLVTILKSTTYGHESILEKAISALENSCSFYTTIDIVGGLTDYVNVLNSEDLSKIFSAVINNDQVQKCYITPAFLERIFTKRRTLHNETAIWKEFINKLPQKMRTQVNSTSVRSLSFYELEKIIKSDSKTSSNS